MNQNTPVRVAINGYGVIGKRVVSQSFKQVERDPSSDTIMLSARQTP